MSIALLKSLFQCTRLRPLVLSLTLGTAIIALPLLIGIRFEFIDATLLVRVAMVISISGAAFVLDDPTTDWTRVMPVGASRIAAIRIAFALLAIAAPIVLELALAPRLVEGTTAYEPWGLIIEPYALLAWVWAAAWWRARTHPDGAGSPLAAPALLIAAMTIGFLPDSMALFMNPAERQYGDSRIRWLIVLLAGVLALAANSRRA